MDGKATRETGHKQALSVSQLVELVCELQGTVGELRQSVAELKQTVRDQQQTIAELQVEKKRLKQQLSDRDGQHPTQRLDDEYSLEAEDKRAGGKRRKKQKSSRRGRRTTAEKLAEADRHEDVFPEDVSPDDCTLHLSRVVWRIENGQAVLVAYHVYHEPGGEVPTIPGTLGRSEYGIEIYLALTFMVFITRLSMDKVCEQFKFFWGLKLAKSQADALLNRLSRQWEPEFDTLCTLLANSAVVHADETGWSINSVWAFLSEQVRIILFGVHKDGATLATLLPKDLFGGVLVSDDAAVYRGFTLAQKCWAHLIRKAIRLTLLQPDNKEYRTFLTGLLELYRKACRLKRDRRLKPATRELKARTLDNDLWSLCGERYKDPTPPATDAERDFVNLVNELLRLMEVEELFTFVIHPAVPGTNNESERTLRDAASDRKTGRTSKTIRGARRRTVLTSVLESLRLSLPEFTLNHVLEEVISWLPTGRSRFRQLLESQNLPPPECSTLDALLPATGVA
ncbi:MAG: transposase [Planctomycetaceae bacterium]|jgi:transposase|nr:transposase [Planctomycetaceae bacterium]